MLGQQAARGRTECISEPLEAAAQGPHPSGRVQRCRSAEQIGIQEHIKDPVDERPRREPEEIRGESDDEAGEAAADHPDIERQRPADPARQ
jgi:hypothetical protein